MTAIQTEPVFGGRGIKAITVEAVVIRADGTREDLGVVAEYHRSRREVILEWLQRHLS